MVARERFANVEGLTRSAEALLHGRIYILGRAEEDQDR